MKKITSIQLKAAFLLTIFTLNIVVGFACAIGMDMGFNTHHHHHDEEMEAMEHVHADGSKHFHHNEAISHHDEANNQDSKDDNCCKDKVTGLTLLDKSVPQSYSGIHPVFFTAFLASYYNINLLPHTDIVRDIKQFVRSYHPPIPDIRIAIQSFQI